MIKQTTPSKKTRFHVWGTAATLTLLAAAGGTVFAGGTSPSVTLNADKTEVVIAKDAPRCVRFAADELTNFLSRAFGTTIPLANAFTPGKAAITLGNNAWSQAAGICVEGFVRDEFAIRADPATQRIYITGKDDPKSNIRQAVTVGGYPRTEASTLFGVYEFLERFFGCRFYFPGAFGEIVPPARTVSVPAGDWGKKPVFTVRYVYLSGDGEGFLSPTNRWGRFPEKALNWMRLRMETKGTPCCHGINSFKYVDRFLESNPEYFALMKDRSTGKLRRDTDPKRKMAYHFGQLCHSSKVRDVLAKDVRKRFADGAKYVDVMPQDGFAKCLCPSCTAAYVHPQDRNWATELVWGKTAELARGLLNDGVEGMLTMMAYSPYRRVPDFDLPTNILVMVAENGPWQKVNPEELKRANDEVKAWARKIGRKVWVWTYPHKYQKSALPGVPQMTPHAWGEYYKGLQPWIFGTFAETESDRWIYNYLNYYIYSRIAWDEKADIDAILDEHYALMFGAGAGEMKRFYELLEKTWIEGIQGHVDDTPLGPVARVPPPLTVWRSIYSPKMLAECESLFASAAAKLAPESSEAKRLAFIKAQLFAPLKAESDKYLDNTLVDRELARRKTRGDANVLKLGKPGLHKTEMLPSPTGSASGMMKMPVDYCLAKWFLDLKPETTYRVSYFLKLDGMFKRPDWKGSSGGAMVEFHDGEKSERYPYPHYEDGTFDWIHRSFLVTTPPLEKMKERPFVMPRVLHSIGTAWFDGLQVEEVK